MITIADFYPPKKREKNEPSYMKKEYYNMLLLQKAMNIFDYQNLPPTIEKFYLELSLLMNGTVGIIRHDDELIAVRGGYSGTPNIYGIGEKYTYAQNKVNGTRDVDIDIVVGRNNILGLPFYPIIEYCSSKMTDIDTSIDIAIINTRMTNIIGVQNEAQKKQVDILLDKMTAGQYTSVVDDKLIENGLSINKMLDRGDVSDKISILLQAREDFLSQYLYEIGIALDGKAKKAQLISDELQGYEDYSAIGVDDMLAERIIMCDKINEMFGTDITVSLKKYCQSEERIENKSVDGSADVSADKSTDDEQNANTESANNEKEVEE